MQHVGVTLHRRYANAHKKKAVFRAAVAETLEIRRLLSTWTVTSTLDNSASGTLRYEIQQADLAGGNQTIVFSPALTSRGPATIDLNGTPLEFDDPSGTLIIQGPGANELTIEAQGKSSAIVVENGTKAEIDDVTITGGHSDGNGGGIDDLGMLTILNSVITGNQAEGTGGGIYVYGWDRGSLSVVDSTISGNTALGNGGGGIYSYWYGSVAITDSTISGNVARWSGGGVFAESGTNLRVADSTISGNTAQGNGGGIYDVGSTNLSMIDSTVSDNSAELSGGGIFGANYETTAIDGTIVANNTGADLGGGDFAGDNNLIDDGTISELAGSNNLSGNPALSPLGYYGGPTETMALLPGSPALDAGAVFDDPIGGDPIATDQRGISRSQGASPDIGAYESRGFVVTATDGSGTQSASINNSFSNLSIHVSSNDPDLTDLTGGIVKFTAPSSGASVALGIPALLDASGDTSTWATANSIVGSYAVTATASPNVGTPAVFSLTNTSTELLRVFAAGSVARGSMYTLTLPTNFNNQNITGWNIDWGDGSDPDGDGVIGEIITGSLTIVSHVYTTAVDPSQGTVFDIQAKASLADGSQATTMSPVQVTPGLVITGTQNANEGDVLTYTISGPGAATVVWQAINPSGKQYATGHGSSFQFAPAPFGAWTVEASGVSGGHAYSTSMPIFVAHVAPTVTISGPPIVFVGRSGVFSAEISAPPGVTDSYHYSWNLGGDSLTDVGTAATWATPPDLDAGNYTANLTVTDNEDDSITQVAHFQVLADPGSANYQSAAVPINTSDAGGTQDFAYAIIEQPDGKIDVAGTGHHLPNIADGHDDYIAFVEQFNSDLTVDTSFGDSGLLLNVLGPSDNNQEFSQSIPTAFAYDPITQDIVVTGSVWIGNSPSVSAPSGVVVASYNSITGIADAGFNNGRPWMDLPPAWGHWTGQSWTGNTNTNPGWSGTPYTMSVLPDGSILVAGSQTKYWYSDPQHDGLHHEDDFILFELNKDGSLNNTFGNDGFADSVNPINLPAGETWNDISTGLVGTPNNATWYDTTPGQYAHISVIIPQFDSNNQLNGVLVGGSAANWPTLSDQSLSTGERNDFVIARYNASGHVDTSFGESTTPGKTITIFPEQSASDPNGTPVNMRDSELDNMEILPNGDILAIGEAPNSTAQYTTYVQDTAGTIIPYVVAMAWYHLSNGTPDLTLPTDDPGGTLLTSVLFEQPPHLNATAGNPVAFQSTDYSVIISTSIARPWYDNYADTVHYQSGWALERINPYGVANPSDSSNSSDVIDPTFGALGDGIVALSKPLPFPVSITATAPLDTGDISPMGTDAAMLYTPDGILALGEISFAHYDNQQGNGSTALFVRYHVDSPTPTNLTATATGEHSVELKWTDPDGEVSGYEIDRFNSKDNEYEVLAYVGPDATSYTDDNLATDTTYSYEVRALNQNTAASTYAGPVSTATWPDLSNYGLIETLQVPVNGVPVKSDTTLLDGVQYLIESSGSFYALDSQGNPIELDSEYVINQNLWQTDMATQAGPVDVGVSFDGPGQLRLASSIYSVDEPAPGDPTLNATFVVVRTGGLTGPLTFYYDETPGGMTGEDAAVPGTNYTPTTTGDYITMVAGVSVAVITIPILHDGVETNTLHFTLNLMTTDGSTPFASADVGIRDSDAPVTFSVSTSQTDSTTSTDIPEGGAVTLYITRLGRSAGTADVNLSLADITAFVGTNFVALNPDPMDIHFADTITTVTETIQTIDTGSLTNDVQFSAQLSLILGDTHDSIAAGEGEADITISPVGEGDTIGFIFSTATVSQTAGSKDLVVHRYGPTDGDITVNYSIAVNTNINNLTDAVYQFDYGLPQYATFDDVNGVIKGQLEFKPGFSDQTITIPVYDNPLWRKTSPTLTVALDTPTGGAALGSSSDTLSITSTNPEPVVQLSSSSYNVVEPPEGTQGQAFITINRLNNTFGALSVEYELDDGNGANGAAYGRNYTADTTGHVTFQDTDSSATIPITILYDPTLTDKEQFTIKLLGTTDLDSDTLNSNLGAVISPTVATVNVLDYTPSVQFAAEQFTVDEDQKSVSITVLRGGNPTDQLTVGYSINTGESAIAGVNYDVPTNTTVTIPAGQSEASFPISILDDGVPTLPLSFGLQIISVVDNTQSSNAPAINTTNGVNLSQVVINNVDPYAEISFSRPTIGVNDQTQDVTLTVTRNGNLNVPVSAQYNVISTGTSATAGVDYDPTTVSGNVYFAAGDRTKTIDISLLSNSANTSTRVLNIGLLSPSGAASLVGYEETTITIIGNAPAAVVSTVYFDQQSLSGAPGSKVSLKIDRGGDLSQPMSVHWETVAGSATPGKDFEEMSGTIQFAANQPSAKISVPIDTKDPHADGKSFVVDLDNPLTTMQDSSVITQLGSPSEAVVSIQTPSDTISLSEGVQVSDSYPFIITRTGPTDQQVQVQVNIEEQTFLLPWFPDEGGIVQTVEPSWSTIATQTITFLPRVTWSEIDVPPISTIVSHREGSITEFYLEFPFINVSLTNPVNTSLGNWSITVGGYLQDEGYGYYGGVGGGESAANIVGTASFANYLYLAKGGTGEQTITINRTDSSEPTKLYWSTGANSGTFGGAVAGTDYTPISYQEVDFAAGQSSATITVNILPDTAAYTGDLIFDLNLYDSPTSNDPISTSTVIISQLTDETKTPQWISVGDPNNHDYQTLYTGTGSPLEVDYRNGEDIPTDSNGNPLSTIPTMTVAIYAPLPYTPAELTAQPDVLDGYIALNWQQTTDDKDYFEIERASGGSDDFEPLATVDSTVTTFEDTTALPNTDYSYRVIAHLNETGLDSKPSNTAYALLINNAPVVQPIPAQEIVPGQTFQYLAHASDPDGGAIHYSITGGPLATDGSPAVHIDNQGNITTTGWVPTEADKGLGYEITVTATDDGIGPTGSEDVLSTSQSFWLVVVLPAPIKPIMNSPSLSPSDDSKSLTLSITAVDPAQTSQLSYEWSLLNEPSGAPLPVISNPTASQTVVTFQQAGTYTFSIAAFDSGVTDPVGMTFQNIQVVISQQATWGIITVDDAGAPLTVPPSLVQQYAADWGSEHTFHVAAYDQFGNLIRFDVPPDFTWTLNTNPNDPSQVLTSDSPAADFVVPTGTDPVTMPLNAAMDDDLNFTASLNVVISPFDVALTPTYLSDHKSVDLKAAITGDDNTDDLSSLQFNWTVTGPDHVVLPTFTDNHYDTTGTIRDFTALFYAVGTYELTLTVTTNGLPVFASPHPLTITISPVATALLVTPTNAVIASGSQDPKARLTAVLVDQFNQAMPAIDQPTNVDWSIPLGGVGGSLQNAGGNAVWYRPQTLPQTDQTILDTIKASASGFNATVQVKVGIKAPIFLLLSVLTDSNNTISESVPVQAVISNPSGDPITSYTLTAVPVGNSNGPSISLLKGSGSVGSAPESFVTIGSLDPSLLANGQYKLVLTATASDGDTTYTNSTTQVVLIDTLVKLGNLSLPVTDMTMAVPGSAPISVTRTYNSQNVLQTMAGDLGYGWTLSGVGPAVQTTAQNDFGGEETPSLYWNDLVYVTIPTGQEFVFAFRPTPNLINGNGYPDALNLLEGLNATPYTPAFISVDGSNSTLTTEASGGGDDDDEVWDDRDDKVFVDAGGNGFNPEYLSEDYVLTTQDGATYTIDPRSGEITSTDPAKNTKFYSNGGQNGSGYGVSISADGNYIDVESNGSNIPAVIYTFKPEVNPGSADPDSGDLIGVTDAAENHTTYLYADDLITLANGSTSGYAIITDPNGNVWDNNAESFVGIGSEDWTRDAIPLMGVAEDSHNSTPTWFVGSIPSAIPAGMKLTITYYPDDSAAAMGSETRLWQGPQPHYLVGIINPLGIRTLTATYNPSTGELTSLSDVNGNTANLGSSDSGSSPHQQVSNSQGNSVQDQYDSEGDVIKQIETIHDADGNVTEYLVTISDILYSSDYYDGSQDFYNVIVHDYQGGPFVVPANRASDLNLSVDQMAASYLPDGHGGILWASKQEYGSVNDSAINKNIWVLKTSSVLNSDGTYTVTDYAGTGFSHGDPKQITVKVGDAQPSVTAIGYDDATGLQQQVTANGLTRGYIYSGDSASEGYDYGEFINGDVFGEGLPKGLLLQTWESSSGQIPWLLTESNCYYSQNNSTLGALSGYLKSTTDYSYLSDGSMQSRVTYYAYDVDGNTVLTYSPVSWTTNDGTAETGWVVNVTEYDLDDRAIATYSGTYLDSGDHKLDFSIVSLDGTTGQVVFTDTLYNDQTQLGGTSGADPILTSQTHYDAAGNVDWSMDQYGAKTYYIYNTSSQLIDTIYPGGVEQRTVYNAQGQVQWQTGEYYTGNEGPGAGGLVLENTISAIATLDLYDSFGNLVGTRTYQDVLIDIAINTSIADMGESSVGSYGTLIASTSSVYNAQGQEIESTDSAGLTMGTIYYANGQVEYTGQVSTLSSSQLASVRHITFDASAGTYLIDYSSYSYDQTGVMDEFWDNVSYDSVTDADGNTVKTFRNDQGQVVQVTSPDPNPSDSDPNGLFTQTIYSIGDAPIDGYPLTPAIPPGGSEVIQIPQHSANEESSAINSATYYVYDSAGNLVDEYEPGVIDNNPADTATYGTLVYPHWHYTYDANGNELSQTDPNGNVTYFTYDENGQELSRTLPAVDGVSPVERFVYDQYGNQIEHIDFDGNTTVDVDGNTTVDVYDTSSAGDGQLTAEYRFVPGQTVYSSGVLQVNNATEKTTYSYYTTGNDVGREETVADYNAHTPGSGTWSSSSTSTTYTYDPITGQVASETSSSGTIHYVYDPVTGNHIETWTGTTQSSANDDTLYGYNSLGQLVSVTTVREDGYAAPLVGGAYPVTTYTYDANGDLLTETLPNGVVTTYTYDSNNRLTLEVTKDSSNNVLASYQYTLLSDGLIGTDVEQVVQPSPNALAKDTITYIYDADGHLTSESHDVGSNGADGNDWSQVYIYDLNGNRLETDKSIDGGVFIETAAFIYNADNQLIEQDGWVLGGEGPDVTKFTYDANGNLIEEDVNPDGDGKGSVPASTTTYTYDLRGRQIEEYTPANIIADTSAVTTYSAYDTSGDRIMEGSSYFLIDENNLTGYSQVLEERDGSFTATLARSYVIGLDVVGQTIGNPTTANAVEYILSDGNRSTRQLVNSSEVIQSDWSYDSFGNITGGYNQAIYTGGGRGQPLTYLGPTSDVGFQGGYANPDGSIYFRARNYNPVTGRFNNSDPIGNTFGPGDIANSNLYLFVNDDPRNAWDPSGHSASSIMGSLVSNYIGREFESFNDNFYVNPQNGTLRFGNRAVSTIIRRIYGSPGGIPYTRPRPDLVEVSAGRGDVYEIKQGNAADFANPVLFKIDASQAMADVSYYSGLLNGLASGLTPSTTFQAGMTYESGIQAWPNFQFAPPGTMLVTAANYAVAPGAILWDFVQQNNPVYLPLVLSAWAGLSAAAMPWLSNAMSQFSLLPELVVSEPIIVGTELKSDLAAVTLESV